MSGIVGKNLGRGSGLVKVGAIGADSVTSASIADDAIDSEHYTDGSIDNAHIADDAIDSEHYADGSIDNAHIADDAIDSEHYADASIDNAHLADDAVGTDEIADNAVTLAKMAGGTDGNIISFDASGDPVAIATGSDGEVLTSAGAGNPPDFEAAAGGGITQANFRPNANPFFQNGNMQVAQRGTSLTGQTSSSYLIDRWNNRISSAGTWTITQEALTADEAYEDGFTTALKWDNTTADASLSAGDYARIHYCIEAQDCQSFKLGNSGSATFTVGFWVKATKTGTNILTLIRTDQDRMCCTAYTISSTDTWEYKVVTFPADTSGGIVNNDNGEGVEIDWHVAAGSSFTSGSLQTTWAGRDNTTRAVGQVNHADSTSNNFHLTGVQFEVGTYTSSNIPPFQHESYADNLQRCQRYYFDCNPGRNSIAALAAGAYTSSTNIAGAIQFPVAMRTNPILYTEGGSGYWSAEKDTYDIFDDITIYNSSLTRSGFYGSGNVSATGNDACLVRYRNANARLAFDADL